MEKTETLEDEKTKKQNEENEENKKRKERKNGRKPIKQPNTAKPDTAKQTQQKKPAKTRTREGNKKKRKNEKRKNTPKPLTHSAEKGCVCAHLTAGDGRPALPASRSMQDAVPVVLAQRGVGEPVLDVHKLSRGSYKPPVGRPIEPLFA